MQVVQRISLTIWTICSLHNSPGYAPFLVSIEI